MSVYFDISVTPDIPEIGIIFNGWVISTSVDMPTLAATFAGSYPYLTLSVTSDFPEVAATVCMASILDLDVTVDMPTLLMEIQPKMVVDISITVDPASIAMGFGYPFAIATTVDMPTTGIIVAGSIPILDLATTVDIATLAATLGFTLPTTGFTAIVQNLQNNGISVYTNYAFNSLCYFNGAYLGANSSTGIHNLSGTSDNGVSIDASVTLGSFDFGTSEHKNIPDVFVDFSGTTSLSVTTSVDSGTESLGRTIPAPSTSEIIETKRAKLPLGKTGRHWQIKLANVSGDSFEVHSLEIPIDKMLRKL